MMSGKNGTGKKKSFIRQVRIPLEKKAFHPFDEIRPDTKISPCNNSLTLALSRGERGSGD